MFNDPTLHSSCNKVILSRVLSRYMNLAHALLWCVSARLKRFNTHIIHNMYQDATEGSIAKYNSL